MTKTLQLILVLSALSAATGCVTKYSTMSSHTLAAGPDKQADVVWVLESNQGLLRCTESPSGPVCTRVTTP